mgnify:CR=1 FL=1
MEYEISYDVSNFLDASVEKVIHTLGEAFILVALVVFLFLGDFRSTLIPTIAVPVSLIGAFIFMQLTSFASMRILPNAPRKLSQPKVKKHPTQCPIRNVPMHTAGLMELRLEPDTQARPATSEPKDTTKTQPSPT